MSVGLIFGGEVTAQWDSTATAQSGAAAPHQLGDEAVVGNSDGSGFKYYRFIENPSGGSTIAAGAVCQYALTGGFVVATASADEHMPARLAGVAQASIAAGKRAWVLHTGRGIGLVDGAAVIAGDSVICSDGVAGACEEATLGTDDYATIGVARAVIADTATGAIDFAIG